MKFLVSSMEIPYLYQVLDITSFGGLEGLILLNQETNLLKSLDSKSSPDQVALSCLINLDHIWSVMVSLDQSWFWSIFIKLGQSQSIF